MDGLVVTPTTERSRTSSARLPERSRSRDRSSSQTATPAADRSARALMRGLLVLVGALGPAQLREGRTRCGDNAFRGEAELLVEHGERRARPEVLEGHALAGVADPLVPALRDRGLDRDARPDVGRQDGAAVGLVLRAEPLDAGHGHDAGRDPL